MSSIANQGESETCIAKAQQALRAGDNDKAIKWLQKSIRLYPSAEAETLLERVLHASTSDASASSSRPSPPQPTPSKPQPSSSTNHNSNSNNSNSTKSDPTLDYSSEELQIVTTINTHGLSLYRILGLEKHTADEKSIKLSYRKLAIKCHPDKNKAPGAEEAFKLVSNAFQTLSDPVKRRQYDISGEDVATTGGQQQQQQRQQHYQQQGFHQSEFSAEDIFNHFFANMTGQPMPQQRRQQQQQQRQYQSPFHAAFAQQQAQQQQQQAYAQARQRGQQQQQQQQQPTGVMQFAHWLPILLVILFSLFSGSSNSDSHAASSFSLSRTPVYTMPRATAAHNTPYYVDRSFQYYYGRDSSAVRTVDAYVEQQMYRQHEQQCKQQQQQKQSKVKSAQQKQARSSSEPHQQAAAAEAVRMAFEMPLDACDRMAEQAKKL